LNDVTTEATRGLFQTFKDQPVILALVIIILLLLGYLYYQGTVAADERKEEMRLLYANREFVGKLLAECQPVPR
jgi:cytochrome c oxidase assembly factor CtaG